MLITRRTRSLVAALTGAGLALTLAGCGSAQPADRAGGRLSVVASVYPLEWIAGQVGGTRVDVLPLTRPGAEPHDVELGPRQLAEVDDADLVVYLSGFQPAVDEAVSQVATDSSFNVAPAARLIEASAAEQSDSHLKEVRDPHFWLDPIRLADVATALSRRLARLDPGHAQGYAERAARLREKLTNLDQQFRTGLASCTQRTLVTSHAAFGYLAKAYGLTMVGIAGLTPDAEPSARTLAKITSFVRAHGVKTIYYETLVTPDIARTVARETGVRTAVLDPLEGITPQSAGADYLEVMRSNLATLREHQSCR